MASISIQTVRAQYPGMTDAQAAARIAEEKGHFFVIVVRYKMEREGPYTNFGLCRTYAEADDYLFSEHLYDVEVIYDRRRTEPIPKVVHNAQAIERCMTFEGLGRASEPCCWNCRYFNIPLSGGYLCCRDHAGKGVTEVQREDLCDFWDARNPYSPAHDDALLQNIAPSSGESSNVFIYGVLGTSIIALTIYIIVRYGEGWADYLESLFGIADGFWIGLFVFLGICFVGLALLLIAVIASKLELMGRCGELRSGGDRGGQPMKASLQSGRIVRMSQSIEAADGNESLARQNRTLFKDSETWESLYMLSLIYERVAMLLREAITWDATMETAAHALWRAANFIDGVPDHEENVLTWRKAPKNLDWYDWITVANSIADGWSKSAKELQAAAKIAHVSPINTLPVEKGPKSREFVGKIRKCIRCGVEIPQGRLQCSSCGDSRFIWE
ncbi:MAG: hypothetical protein AB2L11_00920 [Syntrophobacteraceae bacterium]